MMPQPGDREWELFRRSSQEWGLDYVHTTRILPSEVLEHPAGSVIELFQFNGRWGYSLSVTGHSRHDGELGFHFSSYLKWCKPYPDRRAALVAAVAHIRRYLDDDAALMAWCRGLVAGRQLVLFEEA